MERFPSYDEISDLPRPVLCGALAPLTATVWERQYENSWTRERTIWEAIAEALRRATPAGDTAGEPPAWLAVLARRNIAWMANHSYGAGGFADIRTLERLGLVELEVDDDYVLAMVSGFNEPWRDVPLPLRIARDPEIIDRALWRVFEVEGGGEVSLANVDKYGRDNLWRDTFRALVGDGTLDRDRVLDSCLAALRRDFSSYRSAWFRALHDDLEPTLDELEKRQGTYLALLATDLAASVALATRALQRLDKAGRLDDAAFLEHCAPGITGRPKGTVASLLRLLGRVAKRNPERSAEAASRAAWALEHEHADVQSKALTLLKRLGAAEPVRERIESLSPTVRREAAEWLGTPVEEAPETVIAVPRQPLRPIGDDEDLRQRLAAVLEDPSDPLELELVLAALIEHGDRAGLLAPLMRRARQIYTRAHEHWLSMLVEPVAALVLRLAGAGPDSMPKAPTTHYFLSGRLTEMADRPHGPLLATPTEPEGWIEPGVLVRRAAALTEPPRTCDAVAALLRLAPEGRQAALASAGDVPGEFGDALRYALGGPTAPIATPSWWVAAAGARSPLATGDAHLEANGIHWPPPPADAFADLKFGEERWRDCQTVPPPPMANPAGEDPAPCEPTSATTAWISWSALIWPHDAEPFFAQGLPRLIASECWETSDRENGTVLAALSTHPGRFGPVATLTLAVGLNSQFPEQAALATEAFALLVPSGRITAEDLAHALARTAESAKPTRWARALAEAGTPVVVRDTLTHLLPRLPTNLRGLHALLSLLHEQAVRTNAPVTDPALRAWLTGFKGGSNSARTARALLNEGHL